MNKLNEKQSMSYLTEFKNRIRMFADYGMANGGVASLPNFHMRNYPGGLHYGGLHIKAEYVEYKVLSRDELELEKLEKVTNTSLGSYVSRLFRAVDKYAREHNFGAGFPTLQIAYIPTKGFFYAVWLIKKEALINAHTGYISSESLDMPTDYDQQFRAINDYKSRYDDNCGAAFPNFHQQSHEGHMHYGVVFLKKEAVVGGASKDVTRDDLKNAPVLPMTLVSEVCEHLERYGRNIVADYYYVNYLHEDMRKYPFTRYASGWSTGPFGGVKHSISADREKPVIPTRIEVDVNQAKYDTKIPVGVRHFDIVLGIHCVYRAYRGGLLIPGSFDESSRTLLYSLNGRGEIDDGEHKPRYIGSNSPKKIPRKALGHFEDQIKAFNPSRTKKRAVDHVQELSDEHVILTAYLNLQLEKIIDANIPKKLVIGEDELKLNKHMFYVLISSYKVDPLRKKISISIKDMLIGTGVWIGPNWLLPIPIMLRGKLKLSDKEFTHTLEIKHASENDNKYRPFKLIPKNLSWNLPNAQSANIKSKIIQNLSSILAKNLPKILDDFNQLFSSLEPTHESMNELTANDFVIRQPAFFTEGKYSVMDIAESFPDFETTSRLASKRKDESMGLELTGSSEKLSMQSEEEANSSAKHIKSP